MAAADQDETAVGMADLTNPLQHQLVDMMAPQLGEHIPQQQSALQQEVAQLRQELRQELQQELRQELQQELKRQVQQQGERHDQEIKALRDELGEFEGLTSSIRGAAPSIPPCKHSLTDCSWLKHPLLSSWYACST